MCGRLRGSAGVGPDASGGVFTVFSTDPGHRVKTCCVSCGVRTSLNSSLLPWLMQFVLRLYVSALERPIWGVLVTLCGDYFG